MIAKDDTALLAAFADYLGWTYRPLTLAARVARASAFVPDPVVWAPGEPTVTDCCTFAAGVLGVFLARAFGDQQPAYSPQTWKDLEIVDPKRPWSNVGAVSDILNEPVVVLDAWRVPYSGWYYCQGWTGLLREPGKPAPGPHVGPGSHGHTWFMSAVGDVVQASSASARVEWIRRLDAAEQIRRYEVVCGVPLVEATTSRPLS